MVPECAGFILDRRLKLGTRAFERITGPGLFREEEGEGREGRRGLSQIGHLSNGRQGGRKEVLKAMLSVTLYVCYVYGQSQVRLKLTFGEGVSDLPL